MSIHILHLQQFALLRQLPEDLLTRMATLATLRTFSKREMVLVKGPPVPFFCFLMEGRLQALDFTLDGREVGLYFIEQGDYFGELSMIDGENQPEFVIATSHAKVLLLPADQVRPVLFASATLAESLSRRLALRVRQQINQRQILSLSNPLQRVCAQLQVMATPQITPASASVVIRAPTHQELAIMVNLTRETVTRTFQVLLSQGVLTRQGDQLLIDRSKLEALSHRNPGAE